MADYFLAPCGVQWFKEVNALFPERDKSSDGWVGDTSHQARKSEHNPCWHCSGKNRGIVLATDTDIDDNDPTRDMRRMMISELIGDPRVWYVISNGIINSRTYGWASRRYTGWNRHDKHVHTSYMIDMAWDIRPWFGPQKPIRVTPRVMDISEVMKEFQRVVVDKERARETIHVRRLQRLTNKRMGTHLTLDGEVGPQTIRAVARLEKRFGGVGRPRVPDPVVLTRANMGMFKLIA